jgi:PAS domain-containing protein
MPAWGHEGELLVAGSSATASSRVATFQCDESLRIAAIRGSITELLECDASELSEHQWYPFLHASDWPVVDRMGAALSARRGGRYDLRAVSRSGVRLYLSISTMVELREPGRIRGAINLLRREAPRRHIDIGSTRRAARVLGSE